MAEEIQTRKPPSKDDVAGALAEINWVYLDTGNDGGVFDYDLVEIELSNDERYRVALIVYSTWADILKVRPDDVNVCSWLFTFDVTFDPSDSRWRHMGDGDRDMISAELPTQLIMNLPNADAKLERLIDKSLSGLSLDELREIDKNENIELDKVHTRTKPYIDAYLLKRLGGET